METTTTTTKSLMTSWPRQEGAVVSAADHRDAPVSGRDENPGFPGPEEDELDVGVVVDGDDVVGHRAEVASRETVARLAETL